MEADGGGAGMSELSASRRLDAVSDQLMAARYERAAEMVRSSRFRGLLDGCTSDKVIALAERCCRLATDRQRLRDVLDDLSRDEDAARRELLGMLDAARRNAATSIVETIQLGPAIAPTAIAPTPASEFVPEAVPVESGEPELLDPAPRLSIWLLGSFRVAIDGQTVIGGSADKSTPMLRFLAGLGPSGIHKEQLADQFWPDAGARAARRNLHQAIYTIRRLLGQYDAESELVFGNDHYRLGDPAIWRDIDELTSRVEAGRMARRVGDEDAMFDAYRQVDLFYTGELLADHPYDEWATAKREHYRQLHREAAGALLDHHARSGDHCSTLQLASRLLELDSSDEDACRQLMLAHLALGQPQLAVMSFTTLAERLRDEHGHDPDAETLAIVEPLIKVLPSNETTMSGH